MGNQQMDKKGRITVPSYIRGQMRIQRGSQMVLGVKGRKLHVYRLDGFEEKTKGIRDRNARRDIFSRFYNEELDGQGRITIPIQLRGQLGSQQVEVVYH